MNLKNKTAVVTGAGGAIGSALVNALDKEGVRCVLIERRLDLLDYLIDYLDGTKHLFMEADFTKQESILEAIKQINSKFTKIDYLFNVAGVGIYKKIEELTISEWNDSVNINFNAPFLFSKGLLPLLEKSDNSLVLLFGSGMGIMPKSERVAYCATKFGLRGLSLTLSKEFKGRGVDFVHLTLGSVMTDFGTGGLIYRKKLEKGGKHYLKVDEVVAKVIEILKSENRKPEYELYPVGYEKESKS